MYDDPVQDFVTQYDNGCNDHYKLSLATISEHVAFITPTSSTLSLSVTMSSSRLPNDIRLGTPGPSTLADGTRQLRKEVQDGLADWQGAGQSNIRTLVGQTLDKTHTTSHLSSIPLTYIFVTIISALSYQQLVSFFTTVIDSLATDNDDGREVIAETLADAVEVLSQDVQDKIKEDKTWEPSEDGAAGEKGILLVRNLVVSTHPRKRTISKDPLNTHRPARGSRRTYRTYYIRRKFCRKSTSCLRITPARV